MPIDTLFKTQTRKVTPGLFKGKTKTKNGVRASGLFRFCNIGNQASIIEFVFRLAAIVDKSPRDTYVI